MTQEKIAILTDSTCDIPEHLLAEHQISVVPTLVVWGEDTYRDRVDLSPQAFYQRLQKDPIHPKTAQPTPVMFTDHYRKAIQQGAERILVFTLSSALSGTYSVAAQAASEFEVPIRVIDSKGPTMSLGWQVLAAARARDEGRDEPGIIRAAEQVRERLACIVLLDTLEYLHKGGRIGGAAKFLGGLLNLKPLIRINHQEGIVEAAGRARTFNQGVQMMKENFFEHVDPSQPLRIAVLHGNAKEKAQEISREIEDRYQTRELLFNITGPVLGVNTGPGALALCGYSDPP